jgi:hypothetical protein
MAIMDEYGNIVVKSIVDETNHNFSLEFVDNGAILTYDDGVRCVVQGGDKEIFAFIGEDLKGAIANMSVQTCDYNIEITIKAKE